MRAVLLEVPEAMLAERRRLELDERDEVWNGVLHMVPLAGGPHQELSGELYLVLGPLAKHRGLRPYFETGLFRASDDYRVPDQLYCRPEHRSERGAEGAELVVEIRSKGDETYEKIGFYAGLGVREMLIVHPEGRWVELLRAVGDRLLPVTADAAGAVRSDVLGAQFTTVERRLRITGKTASPMCDPLPRDAVGLDEEDARFLAPLLTVTEAGQNSVISPSVVKDRLR